MPGFFHQKLFELVHSLPIHLDYEGDLPDVPVNGVTYNSREVQAGFIFVAVRGMRVDGHEYIPHAIDRGAVAVVGTQDIHGLPVPYLRASEAREALAYMAAAFYNFPGRQMTVVAVTGTDCKTTTSNLLYQIMLADHLAAGIISTANAVLGDEVVDTGFHVTTPEAPDVQRYLARMRTSGLSHVVLESTSHGLEQHRVTGCEFDIGVVTNITHEHLDYHLTYEAYREAKSRLIKMLSKTAQKELVKNKRLAVLNRDDMSYDYLRQIANVPQVSYGFHKAADIRAEDVRYLPESLTFTAVGPGFQQVIESSLVGQFNVSNILAAFSAAVVGLEIAPETAARGIAALRGVPGRMERINMGQPFLALVDFAHTPNALRQALLAIRKMSNGRIIVVYGSAGLRDREKRRLMAEVSVELADVSVMTAEDPRTEAVEDILQEMKVGADSLGGVDGLSYYCIPDRGDAIRLAVNLAKPGDVVMACGKGHEQSMCFGETEYAWDDRTAMRAALATLRGVSGPLMPYLPTQDKK